MLGFEPSTEDVFNDGGIDTAILVPNWGFYVYPNATAVNFSFPEASYTVPSGVVDFSWAADMTESSVLLEGQTPPIASQLMTSWYKAAIYTASDKAAVNLSWKASSAPVVVITTRRRVIMWS